MKQRIAYIDHLKGIAILLVVVGHFIQYNTQESKDNSLFSFIYSFHMPLFMFISGYVAWKTTKVSIFDHYFDFVLKRARTLLLPFFAWPLIVDTFFFRSQLQLDLYDRLMLLLHDPRIGLWFLWYLFFITILFSIFLFVSKKLNPGDKVYLDIAICTVLLVALVGLRMLHVAVYIDSFIQYFAYFFIGVFLGKYLWFRAIVLDVRFFSFFLIVFLMTVGFYSFNDSDFHKLGVSLLVKIVAAITSIFALYYIVYNISWAPLVDKYITKWGVSSLVIYATHFKFIEILKGLYIVPPMNVLLLIVISLSFSILIICFCMFIYEIIKLCPPLNLLLYGQKIKMPVKENP